MNQLSAQFKALLLEQKSPPSRSTVKNYLADVNRFIRWFEQRFERSFDPRAVTPQIIGIYEESVTNPRSKERYLCALRKFFTCLKAEGVITENPCNQIKMSAKAEDEQDPWNLKAFRAHLYVSGSSNNTIKNYIIDIQSFLRWVEQVRGQPPLQTIDRVLIAQYGERLAQHFSPLTVRRRLSSLRKYLRFAQEQGYIAPFYPKDYTPEQLPRHYLRFALLVTFVSLVGFTLYKALFQTSQTQRADRRILASKDASYRTIRFAGTLADSLGHPLASERQVRFSLYDSETASGSSLLWQEVQTVSPNSEGKFSHDIVIAQDLFFTPSLYLGITIENEEELVPRQVLPTIDLAKSAQDLQGLPPITKPGAGARNVVLALDSSGNLLIERSSPTFQVTGGSFSLRADTLVLATNVGSGTNVTILPDGQGVIDLQKPLQNTSNSNNLGQARGSLEVDDSLSILASESAHAAFTIEQAGAGPLITASASGSPRFSLDWIGNASIAADLTIGGSFATGVGPVFLNGSTTIAEDTTFSTLGNTVLGSGSDDAISFKGRVATDTSLIPKGVSGTNDLGSKDLPWDTLFADNVSVAGCIKTASGSGLLGTCPSDVRLKKNIVSLGRILDRLTKLVPVTYQWRSSEFPQFHFGEEINTGLIAQAVESVFPELVTVASSGYKAIRLDVLPFYLLQAVRELEERVSALQTPEKIISPLAEVDRVRTNIISPLAQNASIAVHLEPAKLEIRNTKEASGSAVASIDASGNASFSGQLTTQEASIAGTLRATRIIADQIQGATVSAQYITNVTNLYQNPQTASPSADRTIGLSDTLSFPSFPNGFTSLGPSSLADVAVAGQLSIGAPAGGLLLADNTINVLTSTLELQPLRQGGVSFLGGLVSIDTQGNLRVEGKAFIKDVEVRGVLAANIIRPIPDQDVVIQNATGSSILTINQQGDLTASGSGRFNEVLANTFTVVRGEQEDLSLTETIATASAGTATITVGETKRTILTPFVTNRSLIYLTATSDTLGTTPFVAEKSSGSFTIQIANRVSRNITVNWWIVH